jgi:nucleoside-diphosphate-sugar epimerase
MNTKSKKIVVLGSEGQIGKPLCRFLEEKGHEVLKYDIKLKSEHDLTSYQNTINNYEFTYDIIGHCDFVFFLAYDVGGSAYLEINQDKFDYIQNNAKMMVNIFECIRNAKVPFVFATSSMSGMNWSSYGSLKKLGEHYTNSLDGLNAKLWNVYGPDDDDPKLSTKSHVITDFIYKAKTTNKIEMRTNGKEIRQFLYVKDCVKALYELMKNYSMYLDVSKSTDNIFTFDITSYEWTSVYRLARLVGDQLNVPVIQNTFREDVVQYNGKIEPTHSILNDYLKFLKK